MTTILLTKSRSFGKPRNEFGTNSGLIVYYAVMAFDALDEERSIIQPLDTEVRAEWAIRVLNVTYPDRTYQKVKKFANEGVTAEQLAPFLELSLNDLAKLEIAQKYGIDSE